jgi:restriction system protein
MLMGSEGREGEKMSDIGSIQVSYTARGLERYETHVSHAQLHKYQVVRGDDRDAVKRKAHALGQQWDEAWSKRSQRETAARNVEEKKRVAADQSEEAGQAVAALNTLLVGVLDANSAIEWESLKDTSPYPVARPVAPPPPPAPKKPASLSEPLPTDEKFQPQLGFLDKLSASRRQARESEAQATFAACHEQWEEASATQDRTYQASVEAHASTLREREALHAAATAAWEAENAAFLQGQQERNLQVDQRRERYEKAEPEAVAEYCQMVVENSSYPDCFAKSWELDYNPVNRILILDYQLPAPSHLPSTLEVKYVVSSDSFTEKKMAQRQHEQLYDSVLYQVALRTIHELIEADAVAALDAVVFNGWVHSIDPSTGAETDACVLSVQAARDEFLALNLKSVDPKACFKKLKGVGSARLHSLAAVAPLLAMSREDRRFVQSREVVATIEEGDNLAAMDWEDFEHLIRELFEQEFAESSSEVKVTRASRDGGVDAVIFDPDPLHGGKTVIQAKRYTNTVGVSAVRDLYGTMMNEGANKGILVTTSDYGPDAYEFAKGKPLVLLTGGNLLHLLAQHGHKARIDLQEAKIILGEMAST